MAEESRAAKCTNVDCLAEEVDTRFESSPYAASSIGVYFGNEVTPLHIPIPLLCKSLKLSSLSRWGDTLRLGKVSPDAGHVLIHYLFTDNYQSLKPKGSSPHEKLVAEFTTAVKAYAAARLYELLSLEELSKREIERLGEKLSFPLVLDLVQDAYPDPSADDAWLDSYLKSGLKYLFQDPVALQEYSSLNTRRTTMSISDILIKNLLELVHEYVVLPHDPEVADAQVQTSEASTSVLLEPALEPPKEPEPELQPEPETCDVKPEQKTQSCEPEPEGVERPPQPEPGPGKNGNDGLWGWASSKGVDRPESLYESQVEHVLGNGWKDCNRC
ncbi:hypothetical protein F4779DRAFT_632010 [Xylariaceae sp. FL0662B]|nr:hypothetical protein F4779DRAFT_632010 [Xylariaceae sp. FL0662B]